MKHLREDYAILAFGDSVMVDENILWESGVFALGLPEAKVGLKHLREFLLSRVLYAQGCGPLA